MDSIFWRLVQLTTIRKCQQKITNIELDFPAETFDLKIDEATKDMLLAYLSAIVLYTIPPTFDTDECERLIKKVYQIGYYLGNQATAKTKQDERVESE